MRIVISILLSLIALTYACNNDITTIGQSLVENNNFVEVREERIYNVSTIKLDSFQTSYNSKAQTVFGRVNDPMTGLTITHPYLLFMPSATTALDGYVYDSITLNFKFSGRKWGDTLSLQTFRVHQLKDIPELDNEKYILYNTDSTGHEPDVLSSLSFLPIAEKMNNLYFRLDDKFGKKLYELVRIKSDTITDQARFLKFFKGLTIIPDETNNCLLNVNDSMYINLHYHNGTSKYVYNFTRSYGDELKYGGYVGIRNYPEGTDFSNTGQQHQGTSFADANQKLISQGLSGFMIKMRLPIKSADDQHKTIIKAEIVLKTDEHASKNNFHDMQSAYIYYSDTYNHLRSSIMSNQKAVIGELYKDPVLPDENKYVINITDYYNSLCQSSEANEINHLLIGFSMEGLLNSFDRIVVDEIPTLRIYYAKYE